MDLTLTGADGVKRALQELLLQAPELAGQALREEAEIEMTEAKRRTPVKTGNLKGSGHVEGPTNVGGRELRVRLVFGGPSAPYALFVHENLEALHPNGQAKFLESVVKESSQYLPQRVADRLRAKLARLRTR